MAANSAPNVIMFEYVKYIRVSCQQVLYIAILNSAGDVPYFREAVIHIACKMMIAGYAKYRKKLL